MISWIIVLALVAMLVLLLCYLIATAPAGYEDEQGWHADETTCDEDRE